MAALTKLLTASPNQIFTLSQFCELFGAAKSTLSEDIKALREVFTAYGLGKLDTVAGAAGGVRYRPFLCPKDAADFIRGLCQELSAPSRLLAGGFLYLSDILSLPQAVKRMGIIIAQRFYDAAPDFVLTMETKGIPVALTTADALGVPLIIARRSSKVYEGSAVNINYVTGSSAIETMSLSRRAIQEGQRALIVDDFLKAGGTAQGMVELMGEFNAQVVGTAFVMATDQPRVKRITGEMSLMVSGLGEEGSFWVRPGNLLDPSPVSLESPMQGAEMP